MNKIKVSLGERSYEIIITDDNYAHLGKEIKNLNLGKDALIITNRRIKKFLGKTISSVVKRENISLHMETVPDSERSKSLEVWANLLERVVKFDRGRELFLIALGGGVVGDLTGFLASVYKRGIPYIQIPTTLLAQVDSAIGGKTAIDLPCGKNLLGTFYQPRLVYSEISALKSLPFSELRNGLAEVIKYGAIKNRELFGYLEKKEFKDYDWEYLVFECSKIKAEVVEKDEYDKKKIRMILNFGHTIGHGIETASEYSRKYSHGEAISLGMLCAVDIGNALGITPSGVWERLEAILTKLSLPRRIKSLRSEEIISAIGYDKKFRGEKTRMVLLKEIGEGIIVENIPWELINRVIRKRMG
ncbi:MAG: 3-dehydroquinate synthase [Candidatus Omnitrophica bacterium]|nr:3-dehydroquinate synthase [Candidatus Omnitrophota bacterium]MCM8793974.1 3-dehydroquinate synthase [Candidatus Omnitrophota bacterium]